MNEQFETRLLIGGDQVAGDGAPLAVENPYTESTLATVALPSAEQVDAAIAAAREAARDWGPMPAVERARAAARGRDAAARPHRRAGPDDDARGRQAARREP